MHDGTNGCGSGVTEEAELARRGVRLGPRQHLSEGLAIFSHSFEGIHFLSLSSAYGSRNAERFPARSVTLSQSLPKPSESSSDAFDMWTMRILEYM